MQQPFLLANLSPLSIHSNHSFKGASSTPTGWTEPAAPDSIIMHVDMLHSRSLSWGNSIPTSLKIIRAKCSAISCFLSTNIRDFHAEVGKNNIMRIVICHISHNVAFYFAL
jgi:hypothetical protein